MTRTKYKSLRQRRDNRTFAWKLVSVIVFGTLTSAFALAGVVTFL